MDKHNCLPVSREFYDLLDQEERGWLLFECLSTMKADQEEIKRKLMRKVKIDHTIAGALGLIGGFIAAMFGKIKF